MIRIELSNTKRINIEALRKDIELAIGGHAPIVVVQEPHTTTKPDGKAVDYHGYILDIAVGEEERQTVIGIIDLHEPEKTTDEESTEWREKQKPVTREEFENFVKQTEEMFRDLKG